MSYPIQGEYDMVRKIYCWILYKLYIFFQELSMNYDYIRYDLEITEKEAHRILKEYWECALTNKDIYPHLEVLWKALMHLEDR